MKCFIHSINLKKAGVGQPKYCNNAYVHVVLTNLCSIIFYLQISCSVGRQIIEDLLHKGSLCMEAPGFKGFPFKLFNTSADLTSYEEPVITLSARFLNLCKLSFSCLPHVSHRGEQLSK